MSSPMRTHTESNQALLSLKFADVLSVLSFFFQVNLSNFDLVMESDLGTFTPVALQFTGSDAARQVSLETKHCPTIASTYTGL